MRILIVDDERNTREGIQEMVDWATLGIGSIDSAFDGLDALEKIKSNPPDILLCDVRMPRMDGIALVGNVRDEYPHMQIIFLSGYSDSEYLKAAIKYQVVDYVEKPVDISILEKALCGAMEKACDQKSKVTDAIAMLVSKILTSYSTARESHNRELARLLNMTDGRPYRAVWLQFSGDGIDTADLLQLIIEESFRPFARVELALQQGLTDWVILISSHNEAALSKDMMSRAFVLLRHSSTGIRKIGMAMSDIAHYTDSLSESLYLALLGKSYIFANGFGFIAEPRGPAAETFIWGEECLSMLPELASQCRLQEIDIFLEKALLQLKEAVFVEPQAIRDWLVRFLITLNNSMTWLPGYTQVCDIQTKMESIRECAVIEEGFAQVEDYIQTSSAILHGRLGADDPVQNVVEYIKSHFDKEISLAELARQVSFSPNYLGCLFRERTGKPFRQYLVDLRIVKAKELMNRTASTLAEISAELGFEDYSYFCKVFKKSEGVSPKKYREMNRL